MRLHGDWRLETDSTSVSHCQAKQVRVIGIPAGSESTGILVGSESTGIPAGSESTGILAGSETTGIPFNRGSGTSRSKMTGRVRICFVLLAQPNFESIIKILYSQVSHL